MTLLDADVKPEPVLGEDTCELFEAIESSFGINLGDYRSHCGKTVRELAAEIERLAAYPTADRCLTAVSFHRLRGTLQQFGFPRCTIHPSTELGKLLPWRSRRSRWRVMGDRLGLKLPVLCFPAWAILASLLVPGTVLICLRVFGWFHLPLLGILIWSIVLVIPSFIASVPLARTLPLGAETCGGLAEIILALNYTSFASQNGISRGNDVLWALRQLIATGMSMSIDEVSPDTRIPQDLNIY